MDRRQFDKDQALFAGTTAPLPKAGRGDLFRVGNFTSHSGVNLDWKIDCDALTHGDWDTLAYLIAREYSFGRVIGIPRGGLELARRLERACIHGNNTLLIVDDVLTTGGSMREEIKKHYLSYSDIRAVVVFARNEIPVDLWRVRAMFKLNQGKWR